MPVFPSYPSPSLPSAPAFYQSISKFGRLHLQPPPPLACPFSLLLLWRSAFLFPVGLEG